MILLLISAFFSILNIYISKYLFGLDGCVMNSGVAFGIRIDYEIFITLFIILFLIVLGVFLKGKERYIFFSLSILGLSNLFVRILYGNICDYINLITVYVNIADIAIVLIAILGGFGILFPKKRV